MVEQYQVPSHFFDVLNERRFQNGRRRFNLWQNRHLFGGIEPSNMISFNAVSSYQASSGKARIKIIAELPKETTINGQTLCTIAGAIIRKKKAVIRKMSSMVHYWQL